MRLGGQIAAAIEILETIYTHHQPAARALSEWGRSHRFAGSKDRSTIGNLVYDVLRQKNTTAAAMGHLDIETPNARANVLGALRLVWGLSLEDIQEAFSDQHAPAPLSEEECGHLRSDKGTAAKQDVLNMPLWLKDDFQDLFGDNFAQEVAAICERAPIDIRVNTLNANLEKVEKNLAKFSPQRLEGVETCLRFEPPKGSQKPPALESALAHGKGWFEIQDAGSQLVAKLTGAAGGMQVLDYCAGAGGKTLALAAQMQNKGQIYAYDNNAHRLRPIVERLKRAKVRNCQIIDAGDEVSLLRHSEGMDLVLVDAPCTGTGTWRRNPDSKWRLKPGQLDQRCSEQKEILRKAAAYVKKGGLLVYVTCSLLRRENDQQIAAFLQDHKAFTPIDYKDQWVTVMGGKEAAVSTKCPTGKHLLLTPFSHKTDGFFMSVLRRH